MERGELKAALLAAFRWQADGRVEGTYADYDEWWRDGALLAAIGSSLADLVRDLQPSVILGPEAHGSLLGPLVAAQLGIGFVHARKKVERLSDKDEWLTALTPPDYRDRNLELCLKRRMLNGADRVVVIDDWADTGGQLMACRALVGAAGAHWGGAAVIVDALARSSDRMSLDLRSLLHVREL